MKKIILVLLLSISQSVFSSDIKETYLNYCMAGFIDMLSFMSPAEVSKDKDKYKKQALQYKKQACPVLYAKMKDIVAKQGIDRAKYLGCFNAMNGLYTVATKKKYMDKKHSDYAVNTCNNFKTRNIKSIMGF